MDINKKLGYCGLDCTKCAAFIATKNNDESLRRKTAKLWAELNNAPISPADINCEGCKIDGKKTYFCQRLCAIRKCAIRRAVENCGDCSLSERCKKLAQITENNQL